MDASNVTHLPVPRTEPGRQAVPSNVLTFPRLMVSTVEPAPLPDNFRTVIWLHRKGSPVAIVGRWA